MADNPEQAALQQYKLAQLRKQATADQGEQQVRPSLQPPEPAGPERSLAESAAVGAPAPSTAPTKKPARSVNPAQTGGDHGATGIAG